MINKLLIANRGEIAVRIMRTARRMGIRTVAVYSEIDRDSLHVQLADEAYCLGHSELSETYLNIPKIIGIALDTACTAVHPGYGFLAENAEFVRACNQAGLLFIGPGIRAMQVMGNKIEARKFVESVGVPLTKGSTGNTEFLLRHAEEVGFPVLVKAAAGGGGKGMRIVRSKAELPEALESTSREAASYFADGTVYIEKFIENPRHIEIQLLGDLHGNMVYLFERECSIQRRYQKIIEESPSPTLAPEIRRRMGESAVAIGKAIGYSSAGTIEFLVDANLDFFFLEMNTRIQVEHPVTELTTGIDIVEQQLLIAAGEPLAFGQEELFQKGHAIECRIYAEDPANNFLPCPGKMSLYHEPAGEHIRVDSAIAGTPVIRSNFDPMISKLISWGETREEARVRMINALQDYAIQGITCNIPYLSAVLGHDAFISNTISTKYCDEHSADLLETMAAEHNRMDPLILLFAALAGTLSGTKSQTGATAVSSVWESIGYWRHRMQPVLEMENKSRQFHIQEHTNFTVEAELEGIQYSIRYRRQEDGRMELEINDAAHSVWVSHPEPGKVFVSCAGQSFELRRMDILPPQPDFSTTETSLHSGPGNVLSPMPGRVIKVAVSEGQTVKKGELLVVVEAMKMENNILSLVDAVVEKVNVSAGDLVDGSIPLVHLVTMP